MLACGEPKDAPKPPAPTTQHGSGSAADDLEKMLDVDQRVADHGPAVDAAVPVDAAAAIAAALDAGVPVDAGIDPQIAERKRREAIERKRREQRRLQEEAERLRRLDDQRVDDQRSRMPYGAPPVRRRVV